MVVNSNTQLGLDSKRDVRQLINSMKKVIDDDGDHWGATRGNSDYEKAEKLRDEVAGETGIDPGLVHLSNGDLLRAKICDKIFGDHMGLGLYLDLNPGKCFLITKTVETCAEMIRIADNFSTGIFTKLFSGPATFLLGRNEFFKVIRRGEAVIGYFWNKERNIAFEFGFDLSDDRYYFPESLAGDFNRVTRILTFILLGDIETVILEPGRSNNKPKNDGKITNTSEFRVSVVDSKWNKILIRTDGFGVRGHFRLQACGLNHSERKLVWINAFEKHGYTRKAGILR